MSDGPARLLFVCSRNQLRSPTAEAVLNQVDNVTAISAGTNHDAETPLSGDLIEWADKIYVMESGHKQKVARDYRALLRNKPIRNLAIPDNYRFMDANLVARIEGLFPEYFA